MCGRFTLSKPAKAVAELFDLPEVPDILKPHYNVAPSQPVAVVGLKPDGRTRGLTFLRWGLVPHWSSDANPKVRPINARAETVAELPTFRDSFALRRCLIPADGFYEWAKGRRGQHPHHFRLTSGGPLAFAGIWDVWGEGREKVVTCCIVTTVANELVGRLHDRMPVILPQSDYARWLDADANPAGLKKLLASYPAAKMEAVGVGTAVNSPRNDGPELLKPVNE